jgi:hypothetical protein
MTENYFLSAINPLANIDQRDAEAAARRIAESPLGQQALQKVSLMWRRAMGADGATEQAWSLFEGAIQEFAFNYILKAVGCDGNYPRIVQNFRPAHRWFGMDIPGSRIGGDNPDNSYRHIGITHGARYELDAQTRGRPPAHASFSLVSNFGTSKTIAAIDSRDMVFEGDGSFQITIDDRPADGRRNHLTTTPGTKFLYIRDSMEDWAAESPYSYRITRLDAPTDDPMTEARIAELAADIMADDVPLYYWFTRLPSGLPKNTQASAADSSATGGLITQAGSLGHYRLRDDEAVIVTVDPAGAAYSGFVAHDWWFRSIEYWKRTSSLTSSSMLPNRNGTRTLVMSNLDPGVHNWIDPGGLQDLLVYFRWQGLPRVQVRSGPTIAAQCVKISDLGSKLPDDTVLVTSEQRSAQLAARALAHARRWLDH